MAANKNNNNDDSTIIGDPKTTNHWVLSSNNTLYDLIRSAHLRTTSPKTLPMQGRRKNAMIEPSRTALVIIDMQNFFLHPQLSPHATLGRAAVGPTLEMIRAFRANGMEVFWVNWGIDGEEEALTLPPALLEGFSKDHSMGSSFCSDMGSFTEADGTVRELGGKLCRGAWNARPWGELAEAMDEGVKEGTDRYFHKNRLSGLWHADTPLGKYLQESGITTLFFGGVNSDQCVWSTLVDAFHMGYDVVYVPDCSATASGKFAEEMVRYNADLTGFVASSTDVVDGLKKQKEA